MDGSIFKIIHPFYPLVTPFIPAIVNNVFFVGSLILSYRVTSRFAGNLGGWISVLIAATMAYDVWISFSGLLDPVEIFLMLTISVLFLEIMNSSKQRKAKLLYLMGIATIVLTTTNISGWFVPIFIFSYSTFGILKYLHYKIGNKKFHQEINFKLDLLPYVTTFVLSWAFILLWIWNNIHVNGTLQLYDPSNVPIFQNILNHMSMPLRLVVNGGIIWWMSPVFVSVSIYVLFVLIRKKSNQLYFLFPSVAYFIFLLSSSVVGFSIPYGEPRYWAIILWALIPVVSVWLSDLIRTKNKNPRKIYGYIILSAIIGAGIIQTFAYPNEVDIQEISGYAKDWIEKNPANKVFIQANPTNYIQRHFIPITTGYPDRFVYVTNDEIENYSNNNSLISQFHDKHNLIIVKDVDTIVKLSSSVNFTGLDDYFVINNGENNKLQINATVLSWKPLESKQPFIIIPPDFIMFGFHNIDPSNGQQAGIEKNFETITNTCYTLKVKVRDDYSNKNYPGRIEQQILIDGKIYWQHDISGDPVIKGPLLSLFPNDSFIKYGLEPILYNTIPISTYEGWQDLTINFIATANITNVKILLDANNPEKGWAWGSVSQTVIKDPNLLHC